MKRSALILSATLLALEAAAIPLRCMDDAPVMLPEPDAAPVTAPEAIVTGVCDFDGCPTGTTGKNSAVVEKSAASYRQVTGKLPALTAPETGTPDGGRLTEPRYDEPTEPVWFPEEEPEEPVWEVTRTAEAAAEAHYSPEYFCDAGLIDWGGWTWSWYSELVLPGGGLNIPGRYTAGGYVRDGDGYICLASDVLAHGTVIDTPFGGAGKVYDDGVGNDYTIDVYVGW